MRALIVASVLGLLTVGGLTTSKAAAAPRDDGQVVQVRYWRGGPGWYGGTYYRGYGYYPYRSYYYGYNGWYPYNSYYAQPYYYGNTYYYPGYSSFYSYGW
jgi:hypothetical protein